MSRFHVRPEAVSGTRVAFDAQESRHLTRVLRLGVGAVVEALDGTGGVLTVRIERVGLRGAEGTVLAREEAASESPCRLVLAQGIPKGEKMEGIIRMATELGVARIVPLATARAVVRMEPRRAAARVARWQRVAKEAAKQSGRGVIPDRASLRSAPAGDASRHRVHGPHPRIRPGLGHPEDEPGSVHRALRPRERLHLRVLEPSAVAWARASFAPRRPGRWAWRSSSRGMAILPVAPRDHASP